MEQLRFIAISQYGETIYLNKPNAPRKQLMEHFGVKSCQKMYVDKKDNPSISRHAGYIVAGQWLTLYKVTPFTEFPKI